MRLLGRALAVSAAMWLCAAAAASGQVTEHPAAGPRGPPVHGDLHDGQQQQRRHLDVQTILDPTGMVSHFGAALGQAGRVLGLRIADSVADLVSSAFGHVPARTSATTLRPAWTRGDQGVAPGAVPVGGGGGAYYHHQQQQQQLRQPQPSVMGGILRLLGLDSSKLGAIALNGVIFLAQFISSSFIGRPAAAAAHARSRGDAKGGAADAAGAQRDAPSHAEDSDDRGGGEDADDEEPAGTPLSWILDNPAMKDSSALRDSQDPDLSERLIADIQRRFPRPGGRRSRSAEGAPATGAGARWAGEGAEAGAGAAGSGDTSCIQLLVCKAGPFLRGMQRSLGPALRPEPPGRASAPKGDTGDPTTGGRPGPGQQRPEEVAEEEQWRRLSPVQRMFAHMPTAEEVLDRADTCAQRFPNCKVSF